MKRNLLLIFCTLFVFDTFAQQGYYLYLQSEKQQPFYARLYDKIYSSSENGYLIIPRLGDSTYAITIGFAKKAYPEQVFMVSMQKKDKGFQLTNFGDKGWGLSNIQSSAIIMNTGRATVTSGELTGTKKTDAFSELLANVVNDSAILYTSVTPKPPEPVAQPPVKNENIPVSTELKKDSAATKEEVATSTLMRPSDLQVVSTKPALNPVPKAQADTGSNVLTAVKAIPQSTPPPVQAKKETAVIEEKPFISKVDEKVENGNYHAIFIEQYNLNTDTINVTIGTDDNTAGVPVTVPPVKPAVENRVRDTSTPVIAANSEVVVKSDSTAAKKNTIEIINSDCKNFASDNDLDKFRIKLLADATIEDKLANAKKFFKSKCYSVKQIRALTELFPSDESKLRFFGAAYPFVSDTSNFHLLSEVFETPLYQNQFKTMLAN